MTKDIAKFDIGRMASSYTAVLFARRICQLYFFMLLFDLILSFWNVGIDVLVWGMESFTHAYGDGPPATVPDFSDIGSSLGPTAWVIFAAAWLAYHLYSDFKPAWWIVAIAAAVLALNVYAGYINATSYDMDWAKRGEQDVARSMQITAYLYLAGLVPLHLLFLAIAVRGQHVIHSHDSAERRLLSEYHKAQRPWLSSLRSLVNIPEAVRYGRQRILVGGLMIFAGVANFMNFWRLTIVFIFICLIPAIVPELFPKIDVVLNALMEWRNMRQVAIDLTLVAIILLIYLGIVMLIPLIISAFAKVAVHFAERRMRNSLEDIQYKDDRAPVLFLRSFLNDKVPLTRVKRSPRQWLLDGAGSLDTLDIMILAEGTQIGPTVALGNPNDPAPPYGVARGYFDHDDWQEAVTGLCEQSAAIILVLDQTEGVEWEIGHISGRKHLDKTLVLLAPEDVGTNRGTSLLSKAMGKMLDLSASDAKELLTGKANDSAMGFMLRKGEPELLTVDTPRQYAYLTMVRRFLRLLPDHDLKNVPSGASDET